MAMKLFVRLALFAAVLGAAADALAQREMTREEYIATYAPLAIQQQKEYGIPASIKIAQGIIESRYGNSDLSRRSNNHFGIKCKNNWIGDTVRYDDDALQECFRRYGSIEDSYRDHSEFLKNSPRYEKLFRLDPKDYKGWAYGLKECGYATAPHYAASLIKCIEDYELYLLDDGEYPAYLAGVEAVPMVPSMSGMVDAYYPQEPIDIDNYAVAVHSVGGRGIFAREGVALCGCPQRRFLCRHRAGARYSGAASEAFQPETPAAGGRLPGTRSISTGRVKVEGINSNSIHIKHRFNQMDSDGQLRGEIIDKLTHKASVKQRVSDNTFVVFNELKEALLELSAELDEELDEKIDKRIRIEYRDRGKFEAQIQVAEDILIFAMQTDVFRFHDGHEIWKNPYLAQRADNAYCGVINIYNFLADSFKYNRGEDEGYLIGRIFINHQMQYFVEGKGKCSQRCDRFGTRQIDREALVEVLEAAISFALDFDLYVPPYSVSKLVTVEQFNSRNELSKLHTGKRLGYEFECEDK